MITLEFVCWARIHPEHIFTPTPGRNDVNEVRVGHP